ncbi:MAG TPA: ATP-binding protein [Pseudonocardiaceae bacterium]|nr:ATP-binding protein [Pseudonocardiaceae bacterium]
MSDDTITDEKPAATEQVVSVPESPRHDAESADAANRWPLRRIISVGVLVVALVSVAAGVAGGIALHDLYTARNRVIDTVDPAIQQALRIDAALVNQESGVRGYALSAQLDFLSPYTEGIAAENAAVAKLRGLVSSQSEVRPELVAVLQRTDDWRTRYAQPTIAKVRASDKPDVTSNLTAGKTAFDSVRASVAAMQDRLQQTRLTAVATLSNASTALVVICVGIGVALVLIVLVLAFGLRVAAIQPLTRLAAEARLVSDGNFEHEVGQNGPREVRELAVDVDRMRGRILRELSAVRAAHATLDARTQDLQRSNSELEQFAYVASHDLQEPLRKVASFCQLLQQRYAGQLDERADQYIEFAVDGAKRMQVLINDLLAFSRVGRVVRDRVPTSCEALLAEAKVNLSTIIEQSGATITAGALPVVLAEAPLLTAVFQNLVGNALKFHGDQPPRVSVTAQRTDGDMWLFSVSDNGIGIAPEYAERIFVIFQRLHGKEVYPGTGIGLAMCRKIIEYHGGTIWLDTTVETGARFCFTLPAQAPPRHEQNEDDHDDD